MEKSKKSGYVQLLGGSKILTNVLSNFTKPDNHLICKLLLKFTFAGIKERFYQTLYKFR